MIDKKRSLLYLASVALFGVAIVSDVFARVQLSLPTLTEDQKKEFTLKSVEAAESLLKDSKDLQKAEDLGRALAESVGITPEAAEKLGRETAEKVLGGPGGILFDVGVLKLKAWKETHGTAVERVLNNTPYYFVAFTRDLNKVDSNIVRPEGATGYRYNPAAAIDHEGAVLIAPGEVVSFPPHIFRSQDNKEYVLAVVGYGEEATSDQRLALIEGRLPVGLAIVDTGKLGEGVCSVGTGQRVKIDVFAITGPNPADRAHLDCLWLCGRRKAKRLEINIGSWDALEGKPEGKWHAPSTLMRYRLKIRQMNDNGWKARYTHEAPKGKGAKC